jgi:hypothetical protein
MNCNSRHNPLEAVVSIGIHTVQLMSLNTSACDGKEAEMIPYSYSSMPSWFYASGGSGGWGGMSIVRCGDIYWLFYSGDSGITYWGPFNSSGCISLLEGSTDSLSYRDCYDDLKSKAMEKKGLFGPAGDEPVGTVRIDGHGSNWTKATDGMWDGKTSRVNSGVIDQMLGGVDYDPLKDLDASPCEPYR